jgi:hypothetical protein
VYSGVFGTPVLVPPARITTPGMVLSNVVQTLRKRAFEDPAKSCARQSTQKKRSDVKLRQYATRCKTGGEVTENPGSAAKKVGVNKIKTTPGNNKRQKR